ncbi:TPA: DUF3828 domain-containing protein [Proteus mirabilis]|nr:DUF3828 domain-containing protein [Proteus mirabilis]
MTNFIRIFIFIIALSPMAISANDSINNEKVTSIQNSILSPEQVVKFFYEGYLKNINEENLIKRYVTPELALKLYYSSICHYDSDVDEKELEKICKKEQKCKKNGGNIVCDWGGTWIETDVNYFIKSQDNYPSWEKNIKVLKSKQTDTYSKIDLILGDGTDPILNLQIFLIKQGSNWKINRVTKI